MGITTTPNTSMIVGLAAIGAVVTWLWISRGLAPATRSTAELQSVAADGSVPQSAVPSGAPDSPRSQPDTHPKESVGPAAAAPPAASVPPAWVSAPAGSRDDSSYDRMLAVAQTFPDWVGVSDDLKRVHESFVLTHDDPDWARQTEQQLLDFLRARAPGDNLDITSVSCRSVGCEVQARQLPGVDESNPGPTPDWQREFWPIGRSLHQKTIVPVPGAGVLVFYERVDP